MMSRNFHKEGKKKKETPITLKITLLET